MIRILILAALLLLTIISNCQTINYTNAFNYLNEGAIDKSLAEFDKAIKTDSLFPNSSAVIDTLCKVNKAHPERNETNYLIGILSARNNFRYDAFYYLNNFLKYSKDEKLSAEARNIIDTLGTIKDDLKYADFIREYLDKVKNKEKGLDQYWDGEVKRRFGENYDYYFLYGDYKDTFAKCEFTPILSINKTNEYTIVKAGDFSFAVISKDSLLKLSQPIILLTRNWKTKESRHFIFHSGNPNNLPDSSLISKLDSFYEDLVTRFPIKDQKKIDYYNTNSEMIGKFYFGPNYNGMTTMKWSAVSSIIWDNFHEIVHIITPQAINYQIPLLGEGIAVYYCGTTFFGNLFAVSWSRDLMLLNREPKISKIFTFRDWQHSKQYDINDNYFLAGAFTKYLIEYHGMDKYKELCRKTTSEQAFPEAIKEVFQKDIYAFENDFRQWLLSQKLPEISPGFNAHAEEIFSMDDTEGDDDGNGQYTYPLDPYCNDGIFDITKFRILKDSSNYYFELRFRNLADRDSVEWGFYRTFATIYIKTDNMNNDISPDWSGNISLEGKPDKVITINDKGIQLQNYDNYCFIMMKLFRTDDRKFGDTASKAIRFSVSRELLNNFDKHSAFFVGINASDLSSGLSKNSWNTGVSVSLIEKANRNNGGCGIKSDYVPWFYDVLLSKDLNQKELLQGYSESKKARALFPYIHLERPGLSSTENPR